MEQDRVTAVKSLAAAKGLTLKDIAAEVGVDYNTFQSALRGRSEKKWKEIEPEVNRLLKTTSEIKDVPMVDVPVIGYAGAGDGADNPDDDQPHGALSVPSILYSLGDRAFEIPSDSYSMAPWLLPHDVVVVLPRRTPLFNYPMLVRRQDGNLSVKIVRMVEGTPTLISINPKYEPCQEPFQIEGLIVGIWRENFGDIFYRANRQGIMPTEFL